MDVSAISTSNRAAQEFPSQDRHQGVKDRDAQQHKRESQHEPGCRLQGRSEGQRANDKSNGHAARVTKEHFGWGPVVHEKPDENSRKDKTYARKTGPLNQHCQHS